MAFDQPNKVLILKSETRAKLNNIQIINLDFVSDIKV